MKSRTMKRRRKSIEDINYVTLILTIILVVSFIYLLGTFGNTTVYGDGETEFTYVTVVSGDSIWTIAQDYTPSNRDLRETVSLIRRYNDVKGDMLYIGDELRVPKMYQ